MDKHQKKHCSSKFPIFKESSKALKLASQLRTPKHDQQNIDIEPTADLECELLGNKIETIWEEHLKLHGPEKASLSRVLFLTLKWDYTKMILVNLFMKLMFSLALLEAIKRLLSGLASWEIINHVEKNVTSVEVIELISDDERIMFYKIAHIISIVIPFALNTIGTSLLNYESLRCGIKCDVALSQLIQRKSLRLHSSIGFAQARCISLVSNEIPSVYEGHRFLAYLVEGPFCLVLGFLWVHTLTGWQPAIVNIPLIIVILFAQISARWYQHGVFEKAGSVSNRRIDATTSCLSSIKVIKMYAWESIFRDKIHAIKSTEIGLVKKTHISSILDLALFGICTRFMIILTNFVYIYTNGTNFDVSILFILPMAYNSFALDGTLLFSKSVKSFFELTGACENIKQYLLLDESNDQRQQPVVGHAKKTEIICTNVQVTIRPTINEAIDNSTKPVDTKGEELIVINELDLKLEPNRLTMIVGQVGSGKSSLLYTLLGESYITSGSIQVNSNIRFAYASQEPWILPESFRDNILMGRSFNAERYKKVIHACSLLRDISLLPNGDETMIGTKGVSLSGGQKARLNLARAIYSQAEVYLLDDPLSAVDPQVANHIFKNCFKELLKDKIVVLVTHQLQFLEQSDQIVIMNFGQKPIVGATSEMLKREDLERFKSKIESKQENSNKKKVLKECTAYDQDHVNKRNLVVNIEGRKTAIIQLLKMAFTPCSFISLVLVTLIQNLAENFNNYFCSIFSQNVIDDLNNPTLSESVFMNHLYRSWFMQLVAITVVSIGYILFLYFTKRGIRTGISNLHDALISSLMKAKMTFFDCCHTGELSSRYGGDFSVVKNLLADASVMFFHLILVFIGMLFTVSLIEPRMFFILASMLIIVVWVSRNFLGDLDRISAKRESFMGPTFTNLSCMTEDLCSIRSDWNYIKYARLNYNLRKNQLTQITAHRLAFETYAYCMIKLLLAIFLAFFLISTIFLFRNVLNTSNLGLLLTLSIGAATLLPTIMEFWSMMECGIAGAKRIREFINIDQEITDTEPTDCPSGKRNWQQGRITFENVRLRYFENEPLVLHGLSFTIEAGERVGIVGRTGAGKSSIVSVLFRLYPFEGSIFIDGVDTKTLGLFELRTSLGVIPQDPVLFNDSLRKNLDPYDVYTDEQIWRALEVVNLSRHVSGNLSSGLEHQISEGGKNFSVGQRQLVCLARAILRDPKVLLIDEATANVDLDTDAFIQTTIKSHFQKSTVVTIAHRLNTILDYDRVMVLDAGKLIEFDTVQRLLDKKGGHFRSMVRSSTQNK